MKKNGESLKASVAFSFFLCYASVREAKGLALLSDCDLASGVADIMINTVFLQAVLSLL